MTQRLIDAAGAAELLGTTERHVRELVYKRAIPFVKVGGALRFDLTDLDAWIASNRTEAST
jgi:excisionase family DNA binding protein